VTGGPSCAGWPVQASGHSYVGATPCAFACHSDNTKPAGSGNDLYAAARATIGTANPIALRFDLLKQATNELLSSMQTFNAVAGNLSVGIYTFNSALTKVYPPPPSTAEASNNFAAAIAAVGAPPTTANGPDTGIQPETLVGSAVHSDTDFPDTMDQLATTITAAGNGASASTPRKVMIIITDGLQNYNDLTDIGGVDVSKCTAFKNMGYTVYTIYTPYYPMPHVSYARLAAPYVEGTGAGSVSYNLQQCASSASGYIEASDGPSLTAALQTILKTALNNPARLAQ
jgi:hypothetical protein